MYLSNGKKPNKRKRSRTAKGLISLLTVLFVLCSFGTLVMPVIGSEPDPAVQDMAVEAVQPAPEPLVAEPVIPQETAAAEPLVAEPVAADPAGSGEAYTADDAQGGVVPEETGDPAAAGDAASPDDTGTDSAAGMNGTDGDTDIPVDQGEEGAADAAASDGENSGEENTDEAEDADGDDADEEIFHSAVSPLIYVGAGYTVKVFFDENAGIPEGAVLLAEPVSETHADYEEYRDRALSVIDGQTAEGMETQLLGLYDLTIHDAEGFVIEPKTQVRVTAEIAGSPETGAEDVYAVHFVDSSANEQGELRAAGDSGETEIVGTTPASEAQIEVLNAGNEGGEMVFETGTFSVFAIVASTTIEKTVLARDGNNYTITVTYGPEAGIPEGADLEVSEITQEAEAADGTTEYEKYIARTQEALGLETGVFAYARFFDIKIVDGFGEKVTISAPVDVTISLADKDVSEEAAANTKVVHFADGAETGDVVNNVIVDGEAVRFEAEGFSAYAIVTGPDAVPLGWQKVDSYAAFEELISTEGVYVGHSDGFYFTDQTYKPKATRTGIKKTKPALTYPDIEGGAVKYYFEKAGDHQFYAYNLDSNNVRHYVRQDGDSLLLTTAESERTLFTIENDSNEKFTVKANGYYWNQQGNAAGNGFAAWNENNNGSKLQFWYYKEVTSDPYGLDGTSYGLMNWNGGAAGKALMNSSSAADHLDAKSLTVMSTAQNKKQLFVPNDSDISMWSFHWIENDKYYLTTVADGSTKYLRIDENGVSLVSETDDNCKIQVIPGSGTHAGEIGLKAGNSTLTYSGSIDSGFMVGGSAGTEWLHLVELSELTSEYFMTYSASKVSVSDENITNGSRVIIYTRSWNDETKQYDLYAIGSDGALVRVYEDGDSIEWVSGQINTLLWNFVEYYWEGTSDPNYYYDLYNQYSEQYLAPQVTDGQVLSGDVIGLNLNGRRDGQYYSTILAWDEVNYSYAGLKVEDGRIVTCPKNESMDFYFAIMEDLNIDDDIHTVNTVDHTQYGITMKIVDLENGADHKGAMSQYLGNSDGGVGRTLHQGLLSTNLGDDGYPTTVITEQSLGGLYSQGDLKEVNHLFIESTYHTSGYFEYDSTQNYAYLDGTNFKVYKELGTYDNSGGRNTLKHGQFFPFNDLRAGEFASVNGKNLYTFDETSYEKPLPESDPRKYEQLYTLSNSANKDVDYYFAVELEAGFTQTPNGLDAWGHDIIFEFTGDDDFWLYVDGELVIDLGGIHSSVPGSVNFRTGKVKVNGVSTTLRDLFYTNYLNRDGHTEADAEAYVNEIFEQRIIDGETCYVFKDYTPHDMRIFYMERGAGASNLQMRFNLAAIKKGTVQLSKELAGIDDTESVMAEFPYQILYKMSEEEGAEEFHLKNAMPDSPMQNDDYVFYKDSVKPVKYEPSMTIGGVAYEDVFFLKPGEAADISFPDGMTSYRIVECGVNTEVYSSVTVNGEAVEGTVPAGESGKYKDFGIGYATTDARAKVNYVNEVNPNALRTLTISKELYDESGETRIPYEQNKTPFRFRLYLATEYDQNLNDALVNMHVYHVKDINGNYCRWDTASQEFVSLGKTNYSELTDAEKVSATFNTSTYGQITKIPIDHTVEIRNVLAGTQYRVEERPGEIPDGYSFQRYEWNDHVNATEEERSGTPGINGTVVSDTSAEDPNVIVRNLKGWGLRVNKIWSDAEYMSDREPTFFAVFIDENENQGEGVGDGHITLVDGTVRQLKYEADPQTLYWYFDRLHGGRSFDKYIIREVKLTGDYVVDDDGVVSGNFQAHSIHHGGELKLDGKQKGETESSEFAYTVLYEPGETTDDSNVRVDTVTNNRPGIILKKAKWNGTDPLAGAVFSLKDNDDNLIGTFTSDDEGLITVAFLRDGVEYTLTETSAPQSWYGLQEPLKITLNHKTISASGPDSSWYTIDNHTATPTLTVKDRPYTFQAVKKDGDTDTPMSGVTFALHKEVTVGGVTAIDLNPMPGYENLQTDSNGMIPQIDNTLPAGKYELREKTTLDGYQMLSGYIQFIVSGTGMISLIPDHYPEGVTLTGPAETEEADGTVSYLMTIPNHRLTDITLKKVDDKNRALTGAKFQLCKYGSEWEEIDQIDMTEAASVKIKNLTPGRYRLTEIKAPDGYIMLSDPVYFNIQFDGSGRVRVSLTDSEGTGANANNSAAVSGTTITVANTPGEALPLTGGPGTKALVFFGGLLAVLAGILLWRRQHMYYDR